MQDNRSNQNMLSNIALRASLAFVLLLSLTLAACGFQLRGVADLSFKNLYIQGAKLSISRELNRSFKTNGIQVVKEAADAELLLELINEINEKRILSLAGGGTVNEFELFYRVHYRTKAAGAATWSQVQTVEARRDYTYSDANLLAKQDEEKRLNDNMRSDVISGILRRLAALKK